MSSILQFKLNFFFSIYTNGNVQNYIGRRGQRGDRSFYRHTLMTVLISSEKDTLIPAWVHLREYAIEKEQMELDTLNELRRQKPLPPGDYCRAAFLTNYIEAFRVIVLIIHLVASAKVNVQFGRLLTVRFAKVNVRFARCTMLFLYSVIADIFANCLC